MSILLEPIDTKNRVGEDFKYDDIYLNIEVEIEKSFNATNEGEIKWDTIISSCEKILITHSKDLKIASYWLYAQWKKNGWSGFFDKLDAFGSIIQIYEKSLFPKPPRRKIKIFQWLESVFGDPFLKILDQLSEQELEKLKDILQKLGHAVPLCVEEDISFFKEIAQTTNRLIETAKQRELQAQKDAELRRAEEEKRREEEEALKEVQNMRRTEESHILSALSSSLGSQKGEIPQLETLDCESLEPLMDQVIEKSKVLIKKFPVDYFALKALFSIGMTTLEMALVNEDVVTDDFIPSDDILTASRNLLNNGVVLLDHIGILEEQLTIRPTWIEGYFLISQLLFKLEQGRSAKQLEELILHTIYREKELLKMHVGERELIEGDMLSWVNNKLSALGDNNRGSTRYRSACQKALMIKQEKTLEDALEFLEQHYGKSTGEEERFRWRLIFSEFALEIGNKKLALSILLELERIIEQYAIDKWQPELAIDVYDILLKPILLQELGNEGKERIYQKLSILDMQKIINL